MCVHAIYDRQLIHHFITGTRSHGGDVERRDRGRSGEHRRPGGPGLRATAGIGADVKHEEERADCSGRDP